jgi:hypothetical protein
MPGQLLRGPAPLSASRSPGGGIGALVVLVTNVALLLLSGSLTLVAQRRIR